MTRTGTFVLSAGRCGTQWLTQALAQVCGSAARVEHEPLHNGYHPSRMLGAGSPEGLSAKEKEVVLGHLAAIERELETRDYLETGHPCWSSVPWLCRRLAGRVRVIHLVRHPVPTACSWLSHGAFVPPLLPHLPMKELLTPRDAGVAFPEYRECWGTLTPFEKCLYYWGEVNALGLRLERAGAVPWLRVSYEELFADKGETFARVLEFIGAPTRGGGNPERAKSVDRFRFALMNWPETERVALHPRIIEVAAALGYEAAAFDLGALRARFGGAIQ